MNPEDLNPEGSLESPESILKDYHEHRFQLEDRRVAIKNPCLKGIAIAYAVTGGIAAIEAPRIIRELRRYGAEVRVYVSPQALSFVTPLSLEWASAQPIVTSLTAAGEQVMTEDILLVSPATANIIAKAATGIADENVSTLIAGALGKRQYLLRETGKEKGIPPLVMMLPSMHVFLDAHPALAGHRRFLETNGCVFLDPRRDRGEEDKLKTPTPESIAPALAHAFYQNYYRYRSHPQTDPVNQGFNPLGEEVLITAGATSEEVDGVRILTNRGSGETGLALARYFYGLGIQVRLLFPASRWQAVPPYLLPMATFFDDYTSYKKGILDILRDHPIRWGIFTAAVSDFRPTSPSAEKMASDQTQTLSLSPQPKVIAEIRKSHPRLNMVVFKYTVGKDVGAMTAIAKKMAEEYHYVVANRREDLSSVRKIRYLFTREGEIGVCDSDQGLAQHLVNKILPNPIPGE